MVHKKKGRFVALDGLDKVGKGTLLGALTEYEAQQGKSVFCIDSFQKMNNRNPTVDEVKDHDVLLTSEPTYCGLGKIIRNELIAKQKMPYTNEDRIRLAGYAATLYGLP